MRRIVLIAAVAVLLGESVAAAAPRGAPGTLRPARAADHAHHRGLSEWWTLRLVRPARTGWLEVRAYRESNSRGLDVMGGDGEGEAVSERFAAPLLTARARSLTAGGPDGRLQVRRGGRRIVLTGRVQGRLKLTGIRRGVTATRWRLGEAVRYPSARWRPVTLSWSMLVATAKVHGTLTLPGGRQLRLDGWRASYEHGWGDILREDGAWSYWDQAIVHRRGGRAWIVFGLNRSDTVTGPGARDAQWLGLLARVGPHGTRICRPHVHRAGWRLLFPEIMRWATRMRLRCRGMSLRLRDGPAGISEYQSHIEIRNRTRAGRHRMGFAMHLGHEGQ
jgi:hypothetical protein